MSNKKSISKTLAVAAVAGMVGAGFSLSANHAQAGDHGNKQHKADSKCGGGQCGEKKAEGKCGEKKGESKCGEKKAEGKCGEKKSHKKQKGH